MEEESINPERLRNAIKIVVSIAICLLVGFVGGRITSGEIDSWYLTIHKPTWNPPNWLFFPVWTTLYVLMGIALFLVWKHPGGTRAYRLALLAFFIQLLLNFLWSVIFFNLHSPAVAFGEIVLLWIAILCTIIAFKPFSRVAAWLLVPYIAWVSFAAFLNYTIMTLNG